MLSPSLDFPSQWERKQAERCARISDVSRLVLTRYTIAGAYGVILQRLGRNLRLVGRFVSFRE